MKRLKSMMMATCLIGSGMAMAAETAPLTITAENPTVTEDFNSMYDATAAAPGLLALPQGWKIDRNMDEPRAVSKWADASSEVMYQGGTSLASNASNGTWNFGSSTDPSDRAIGGLTTGSVGGANAGTRGISLMTSLKNDGSEPINEFNISYNVEKYRTGNNAAGFAVQLYTSADGISWTSAGDGFRTFYAADSATAGAEVVPITTSNVDNALFTEVAPGETIYLAWNISVSSGTTCSGAQGLSVDDVEITAKFGAPVLTTLTVSADDPSIGESFDSMYDITSSAGNLELPFGWRIDRNLDAPRTLGAWADASTSVMYQGGKSLASNASNGTWNFGSTSTPSDRAIGSLSTTVANGTRCSSLMTAIKNVDANAISALNISYNIEKYRNGSNSAGFDVQMYFSTDGINWTNAGSEFLNHFDPDTQTIGEEVVPISITSNANKTLLADVAPGKTIYLAWNITVASGSSPNNAMGLAIDDISISAQFANPNQHTLFIENATGKAGLSVYFNPNDAPGSTSTLTKILNGVTYYAWEMPAGESFDFYAKAANYSFGPVSVSTSDDAYYCMSATGLDKIEDSSSYTGWVDPNRPPFTASGYYLRGDVNNWGADSEWEFSKEADGVYVLYDKTLSEAFKVADANWSSFNYGSNGSNVTPDEPYEMVSGTNDNISCGTLTINCKRIVLTVSNGKATLLLETDDNEDGLTKLYMVGDFNNWNYSSTAGALTLDPTDNLFKGQVTMKAGENGLSYWRLYQNLGMGGVWGLAADATESTLQGNLVKGEKKNAAVAQGTYDVTFSLTDGAYSFSPVQAAVTSMTLNPENVILTPKNPEAVKVLSLNNSLIHYNDQDFVFNDIANAMGANASWTKHTNLGKPLSYHWEEGDGIRDDGTPGAKMMVRSEAWSHIILQEQSSLPRTNPETFRQNVKTWVEYIREYCPNPNAVILLPVNWGYSSDWDNFNNFNAQFLQIYADVADEFGAVVVPVAMAYDNMYTKEGASETGRMFSDDRHPTPMATYMAATMEYAAIMGVDPQNVTYTPNDLSAADGQKMRQYASEAWNGYDNTVKHLQGEVDFKVVLRDDFGLAYPAEGVEFSIDGGGTISADGKFKSDGTLGTFTVTAKYGNFVKTATVTVADHNTVVEKYPAIELNYNQLGAAEDFNSIGTSATATLPEAWRIDKQTVAPRTVGMYSIAGSQTEQVNSNTIASNAKNGIYNFGAEGSNERALGGISTGVDNGTRCVNLYTHIINTDRRKLTEVEVSYDVEKYRKGKNAAGFTVQLYYSYDGRTWTPAGDDFKTHFDADNETAGYDEVPGESRTVVGILPIDLAPGVDVFLAWNISVASGTDASGAIALGIDNFEIHANIPKIPESKYYIYVKDNTSWDSLSLYSYTGGDNNVELFGAWPGQSVKGEIESNGEIFKVFNLHDENEGTHTLIFNNSNNGKQLTDHTITANKNHFFEINDNEVKVLDDQNLETGVEDIAISGNGDKSLSYTGGSIFNHANKEVRIYNISGQLLVTSADSEISMLPFPAGVYIVNSGEESLKIVNR